MTDTKSIAKRYGITDRIEALEKALLSVKGVTEVDLDLSGYLDDIYEVIVIAKYSIDMSAGIGGYYEAHGKIKKDLVKKAGENLLTRTGDSIEDYGEHFYIVFSSTRWNGNREYALFYEHNGREIPVGSEGWVPSRETANRLLKYHESRELLKDRELFIKERVQEKLLQPMPRFNGKPVYDEDHCFFNALLEGDYVTQGIYYYFVNCIPPASMRSDCTQIGEPCDIRIDVDGTEKNVYHTIKKVSDGIWQYCGRCFRGENVERGLHPSYC